MEDGGRDAVLEMLNLNFAEAEAFEFLGEGKNFAERLDNPAVA